MASKNIKGITIEIDGNTKPLSNALGDLNKEIRSVDKELKNVDQALKLDPGNAEQVARKLELLEREADLAAEKVDRLKEAQRQMDADGVDKASEEYKTLSTEIAKAEGQYREISKTAKETKEDFDKVSESTKLLNTYLEATGKTADDLKNISGISKLVGDFEAGTLGAQGFDKVLKAVAQDATGSAQKFEAFKNVLRTVNDGAPLSQIKADLEVISRSNVSSLGVEFDTLNQKGAALDSELKQINNSLKLDPSSLDLCTQKQEVLTQAVSGSEQKLVILNQRFNELKAADLDLHDEEFRTIQREILNTETALTGYETELTNLQNAQSRLDTYFNATGTTVRDFANILGSELVAKIERGEASSEELSVALNKIGASATSNRGELERFKSTLDSLDSGVSLGSIKGELDQLGAKAKEAGSDVDELKGQLSSIGDAVQSSALSDAADTMGELSDSMRGFAESTLDASSQVQDATAKIKVGLGETGAEAEKSLEIVRGVLRDGYGDSIDGVSEKLVYMKQVLGDSVDPSQLQPLLEQFITLEDGGMDFNETVRATKNLMGAFGEESGRVMDLLTTGMQHGLNYTDELGDNLAEYAARWGDAGVSLDQYLSILESGTEHGAYNLDKVGDYLNEFLTSLEDGRFAENIGSFSDQTKELFQSFSQGGASAQELLNSVISDMAGYPTEMNRMTVASRIWSSLGEDNCMDMIMSLGNVENKYGDVAGAAEQATSDNSNSVTTMKAAWDDFMLSFAPVGEKLAEIATKILEALKPAVDWLANALSNMDPTIMTFIASFVGITAAIGPVVAAIGGLIALLGGPVTAIIAGVIAAISAVIAIFVNWGSITASVSEAWNNFCADVGEEWNKFCTDISNAWNGMWTGISEWFSGVGASIQEGWNSFCSFFSTAWSDIWTSIQAAWESTVAWFSTAFTTISETVGGIWNSFCESIISAWNTLTSGIESIWNSVSGSVENAWRSFCSGTESLWNNFTGTISSVWENSWNGIKDFGTNIWETVKDAWDKFSSTVSDNWDNFIEKIKSFWETGWNSIKGTWDKVSSAIKSAWNSFCSGISNTWNGFVSGIQNIWQAGWNGIENTINNIKSRIVDIIGGLVNSGREKFESFKSTLSGIWDSIKNTTSKVWEKIKSTVRGAIDKLKNFFDFHWELPDIALPHFRIEGQFSLNPPQIPTFYIDWYKKGGILTAPTIFGANGSTLLGGGEAGKEAVIPIDEMYSKIDEIIDSKLGVLGEALISELRGMREDSRQYYKKDLDRSTDVVLDTGKVVGELARPLDEKLGRNRILSGRR